MARADYTGSPFSHPSHVLEGLKLARLDELEGSISERMRDVIAELHNFGLVERYLTKRGGQGRVCVRVRLTQAGKARLAAAHRAALEVAAAPVLDNSATLR